MYLKKEIEEIYMYKANTFNIIIFKQNEELRFYWSYNDLGQLYILFRVNITAPVDVIIDTYINNLSMAYEIILEHCNLSVSEDEIDSELAKDVIKEIKNNFLF